MKKRLLGMFLVLMLALAPALVMGAAEADKAVTVGGGRATFDIYDEDAMGSDDASGLATQQSIKAYVDNLTSTKSFDLPLASCLVDGTGPITAATAPNLTTLDNIAAILYDDSGETAGVSWTFRVPSDYSTDLGFYVMVSSNDASGSGTKLDYQFFVNNDDTGFASATAQDVVECTSATLDASNEVLHLNPDATAEVLFTSGAWVTLEIFNASTNDDDLEIKGVEAYYTATQ